MMAVKCSGTRCGRACGRRCPTDAPGDAVALLVYASPAGDPWEWCAALGCWVYAWFTSYTVGNWNLSDAF